MTQFSAKRPRKPQGVQVRVISLGALDMHSLRGENRPTRTGHATTTLILSGDNAVLVDPGLPPAALEQRLDERVGLPPSRITHIFLTSFKPDTCRGITLFDSAQWLISQAEREAVGVPLAQTARTIAMDEDGDDIDPRLRAELEMQIAVLQRCKPAGDRVVPGVDLFPLPGVTPGLCGLLIPEATQTTLICGDAIPTLEHLERGEVPGSSASVEQAKASFTEAVEIADILILGRDNLVVNPIRKNYGPS